MTNLKTKSNKNYKIALGAAIALAPAIIGTVNNTVHTSATNSTVQAAVKATAKVHYIKGYGINVWKGADKGSVSYAGKRLPDGSNWAVFYKVSVNGKTYYNLGGDQFAEGKYLKVSGYVPTRTVNTKQSVTFTVTSDTSETKMTGTITVRYNGPEGWKVTLLDANGNYQKQSLARNTTWKVFAKKVINGQVMYRLGNQRQWIPSSYTNKPEAVQNTKKQTQTVSTNKVAEKKINTTITTTTQNVLFKYTDTSNKLIGEQVFTGKVGQNINIHLNAPSGYKFVNGAPTSYMVKEHNNIVYITVTKVVPSTSSVSKSATNKVIANNNQQQNTNKQQVVATPTVKNTSNTTMILPAGYTADLLRKQNSNKISADEHNQLMQLSVKGMIANQYQDNTQDMQRKVNVQNLTPAQKQELSNYALAIINNVRSQIGTTPWHYTQKAQDMADDVANEYYVNNKGITDAGHYVAGIERAAGRHGLNNHGQYYEDEAGWYGSRNTDMNYLKKGIYFGIKTMLFGGYRGNPHDTTATMHDASRYTEWLHAGDLLDARAWESQKKHAEFAFSVSSKQNSDALISTHFISFGQSLYK